MRSTRPKWSSEVTEITEKQQKQRDRCREYYKDNPMSSWSKEKQQRKIDAAKKYYDKQVALDPHYSAKKSKKRWDAKVKEDPDYAKKEYQRRLIECPITPEKKREYGWNFAGIKDFNHDQYLLELEIQDEKCLVCHKVIIGTPCVDHNHATGKFRGILCRPCNLVVGTVEAKKEMVEAYLSEVARKNI